MFENKVLSKVFEPNREEVTRKRRKLHNKELHSILLTKYYCGKEITKVRWAGHIEQMGQRRDELVLHTCRLRVFEHKVLRKIFGPKRDEVTRKRRKLHN